MAELPSRSGGPPRPSRRAFLRSTLVLAGGGTLLGSGLLSACAPSTLTGPSRPAAAPTSVPTFAVFSPPTPTPAPRQPGSPKSGGTLVVGRITEPTDLDPQLNSSLARQRTTMLTYNNLVKLSTDLSIQPDLAETWKVSPDGKQIEFTLRKGVLWHPPVSRELTAEDVKASYERLLRESPGRSEFAAIESIDVPDKYSVRFIMSSVNAGILASMADPRWGAIISVDAVEQYGSLKRAAVGTGPFTLEEWRPGEETRLRRNPEYFERGKPHVESLVVRTLPDEASLVSSLQAGQVHHAMLEDPRGSEAFKDNASLKVYRSARIGYDFLSVNQGNPPFNKPEVVQAISYALDREECIKAGAAGYAVLTAPATPPMKQWQLPEAAWKPFYRVDLEKAKALLARAGYPAGFEATCLTIRGYPGLFASAQVIQANLKRIGISLKVESVEYPQWVQRWQRRDFEATLNTTPGFADPDTAFYRAFHSRGQNWNNIANPELDRLLDDGRAVFEVEKRKAVYDKVQQTLLERPGHLFLYAPETVDVAHKIVQGFSQHPTTVRWCYQNVWLDT